MYLQNMLGTKYIWFIQGTMDTQKKDAYQIYDEVRPLTTKSSSACIHLYWL